MSFCASTGLSAPISLGSSYLMTVSERPTAPVDEAPCVIRCVCPSNARLATSLDPTLKVFFCASLLCFSCLALRARTATPVDKSMASSQPRPQCKGVLGVSARGVLFYSTGGPADDACGQGKKAAPVRQWYTREATHLRLFRSRTPEAEHMYCTLFQLS